MKLSPVLCIYTTALVLLSPNLLLTWADDTVEPPHAPDFTLDEHEFFVNSGEEEPVEEEVVEVPGNAEDLGREEEVLEESLKNEELSNQEPTVEELKRRKRRSSKRRKRAATNADAFWQDCIVPYTIAPDQAAEDVKNFMSAVDQVTRHTCIKLVQWDSNTKTKYSLNHDGYVLFKRVPGNWGFAKLGNTKAPAQHLTCVDVMNCIHEIFHALGFEHEQKDARRKGFIRINWKNIKPWLLKSYTEMNPGAVNLSDPYDISSTLHYQLQVGSRPEMTLLFSDLSIQHGSYYQFKEVSESYRCRERFCKDFMACENDGYAIQQNGKCECVCPWGLDPATGCTSVLRAVSKATAFPGGKYALPAAKGGCPDGQGFAKGSVTHRFPYTYAFPPYLLEGKGSWGTADNHFCVKDSAEDSAASWPAGSYCIYRYGGSCPSGFNRAWIQFDNQYPSEGPQAAVTEGKVADGVYKENTKLIFCCRQDASPDVPIALPATQPFALFRSTGLCQKVAGAKDYKGEVIIRSDTADGVFGYSQGERPDFWRRPSTNEIYLRYCTYYPVSHSCGGLITLSETKRKVVITSPNYPENYDNNLECHWFLQGPVNSTVTLTFEDFDLEGAPGKCQDVVEVNTYMIGHRGSQFCGSHMRRTHRSILNKMHVTLNTNPTERKKGFKAVVEVHLGEEDCFNHGDYGRSYRGKMDYTEDSKTCLPWSDPALKQCYHYASNPLDIEKGLESNYCRNPGDGVRPWCYVNATGCQRSYCDVCQIGVTYDHRSDCAALLAADSSYCDKERQARANCALTCKDKLPTPEKPVSVSSVKCSNPTPPSDGESTAALAGSYKVGDKVTFRCKQANSRWTQTTTCMGDGRWSPLASACIGCPDGWWPFKDSCYWVSPHSAKFKEAQEQCRALGAELGEIRDQAAMDVFFHVRDDGVDQWLGLREVSEGNWTWQDGTKPVWTKWAEGATTSHADANPKKEYCAVVKFTDDWHSDLCISKKHFNCRLMFQEPPPTATNEECKDTKEECSALAAKGDCQSNPGYTKDTCPKSCDACPKPCVDTNVHCGYWASIGECERLAPYMRGNCPQSCSMCPPPCQDKSHQCAEWKAEGKCEKEEEMMTLRCQRTCQRCPEHCQDKHESCPFWASIGECEANPPYMKVNCRKSCNLCPGPGECVGRPCGNHKCLLGNDSKPVCMCPIGFYGDKCESKFPCVDRASTEYCSAQKSKSPTICKDFPEFAWYMCAKTCAKCA